MHVARMHLIVSSGVSVSSLQYCLLQVLVLHALVLHAGISTPCIIVLQVELQYVHFGEYMTLAAYNR